MNTILKNLKLILGSLSQCGSLISKNMKELKVKNINLTLMWNAVTRTGIVNEDNSSLEVHN